jgi:hypothetical protein
MTTDQAGKHEGPQSQDPLASLDAFLKKFADLTSQLSKGMLDQSTDVDEKELIAAYAKPLSEQVIQLTDYIRQAARVSSKQTIEEIGTILRLTAADTLTESGLRIAQNLSSQKAKIGISDIIKLIKKIILELFEIFKIRKPRWLVPLLDLIDEIVDFLVSIGVLKMAHALSIRHKDYMAEFTQMKRMQRATMLGDQAEEEEDEE